MKLSVKSRYALAAAAVIANCGGEGGCITVSYISEKLGISKIYLEQVFSLLRRGGVVLSEKGSQGGYRLARSAKRISAFDIISAVEPSVAEPADETVRQNAPALEDAMKKVVFSALDGAVKGALEAALLSDLAAEAEKCDGDGGLMFYI